ncbi:MAG: DapH/DapD/GlmU-related protein [Cyclobacteriaceae bacterium]|jgi:NDP-sugar pyrophosphorylase family protein|nr:LpxA family transferase [Flammeovirgaceae bacterium]MCZ8020498.1 DapH/DapD/GlmU-related protein [Cytophagales bacterium]MCZ8328058.1 DapH/DapD/GlmU-related protein [Cyclobacteriaceae bacterium]
MISIHDYVENFPLKHYQEHFPWQVISEIENIIVQLVNSRNEEFEIQNGIAVHKTARIEGGVVLKAPIIINKECFVGANAYLRNGVLLGNNVTIGPGCEVKSSIICDKSVIAHFNFIGDSIIGSFVNIEAGAILANHHNELDNKEIIVSINGVQTKTGITKFGSLIGDNSKIGANAVLNPGTILPKNTIVKRLQLIDQLNN